MRLGIALLFLFGACEDAPHPALDGRPDVSQDAVSDGSETLDVPDVTDSDLLEVDGVDEVLGPVDPTTAAVRIDWAIQSSHSPESWFGWPTVTAVEGGLVVAGQFNGVVELGGLSADAGDDDPYAHAVATRIAETGEVLDLRRLCAGCLTGTTPLLALPDSRYAFASAVHGEVILAPGTASERVVSADHELLVAIVGADGELEDHALVAQLGTGGEVQALTLAPDGGLAIGGAAWALAVAGGPSFEAEEGWFYPGRGFVVVVDAELKPRFAEQLGGEAGSTIAMLHVEGDALYAVGDFGGYPLGVATTFNAGLYGALTLESVSSDDDPAFDLFVARFTLPALAAGSAPTRPEIVWAKRLAHYQNGPRQPTWIREARGGGVELRVDGAGRLERDGEHFALPRPDDYWTSAVLRVSADGDAALRVAVQGAVKPLSDGGFLSVASHWAGSTYYPAGDDGPGFSVPAATSGPDGVTYSGHVLARWRSDGALVEAGQLITESPASSSPPTLQHLVVRADSSAYLVLHGAAPVTLVTSTGARLPLDRSPNYERIIVLRAGLIGR